MVRATSVSRALTIGLLFFVFLFSLSLSTTQAAWTDAEPVTATFTADTAPPKFLYVTGRSCGPVIIGFDGVRRATLSMYITFPDGYGTGNTNIFVRRTGLENPEKKPYNIEAVDGWTIAYYPSFGNYHVIGTFPISADGTTAFIEVYLQKLSGGWLSQPLRLEANYSVSPTACTIS